MSSHDTRGQSGDLVTIARDASLVDWLLTQSRPRRQPPALPTNCATTWAFHPNR